MTTGVTKPSALRRLIILMSGIVLLVAIGTIVFIILSSNGGEYYTEFYILGKDGLAEGYPELVHIGEPETVLIGVHNNEYRDVGYLMEVYLLNQTTGQNESVINSMTLLDRFRISLLHDQNEELMYTFIVNETGSNRLEFLLFDETAPPDQVVGRDRINASYRNLFLYIQAE